METVAVALDAMATRFEIVLHGRNPVAMRAAGEEALAEITRLEARLSLYRPDSEIARVNARAAREPVRVTPEVFALLQHAARLSTETGGAFDITIAPLMRCWGFLGDSGRLPSPEALAAARACVGMELVEYKPRDFSLRFVREGVMLDLGAIGKGYAIEQAAELLREAGITSALIHGGTSTAYAIGHPPEAAAWSVGIDRPTEAGDANSKTLLATVELRDESLSVSAVWGKSFQAGGKILGHVLDPRTGHPTDAAVLAAVVAPSATESDALSTALLTVGPAGHEAITRLRPGLRTLVAAPSREGLQIAATCIALQPPAGTRPAGSACLGSSTA
jgi:thiamine biosynthesis lipoprotein